MASLGVEGGPGEIWEEQLYPGPLKPTQDPMIRSL